MRTVAVVAGAGLCAVFALTGCAQDASRQLVPESSVDKPLADQLQLPSIDGDTMNWLDRVQRELAEDENFGSPAISEDRATVTITWFGEPSALLRELIAAAPESLTVVIQPAAFRPAELAELVERAVASPGLVAGVEVAMGHPENDGSGIRIGIVALPEGRTTGELATDFAAALGRVDVPVTVEVSGRMVPAVG
ncbi:hypothetical protein [Conyzicola sp.]|uniref:hypothetical protein n=1 Tax=Conyzicola sp. TaxID=1969404 RepID=UPI003989BFF9